MPSGERHVWYIEGYFISVDFNLETLGGGGCVYVRGGGCPGGSKWDYTDLQQLDGLQICNLHNVQKSKSY